MEGCVCPIGANGKSSSSRNNDDNLADDLFLTLLDQDDDYPVCLVNLFYLSPNKTVFIVIMIIYPSIFDIEDDNDDIMGYVR